MLWYHSRAYELAHQECALGRHLVAFRTEYHRSLIQGQKNFIEVLVTGGSTDSNLC